MSEQEQSPQIYCAGPVTEFALAPPVAPNIVIISEDQRTPLVTIHPNGELEYGPGYTPDEAARCFWDALSGYVPNELSRAQNTIERVRAFCSPGRNTDDLGYLRRSKDILALLDEPEAP